jgi:hypothetical protein
MDIVFQNIVPIGGNILNSDENAGLNTNHSDETSAVRVIASDEMRGNEPSRFSDQIKCPISIHFGAVAWGCGFYVGVLRAMETRFGSNYYQQLESVHGDSAGVIFALGVAIGTSADKLDSLYRTVSERCHSEGIWNNKCVIDSAIDELLHDPETYLKVKGKLSVGVTEFPLKHVRYSEWKSNDDLRHCLHGSMYLPLYCEAVPLINGKHVIDGGFSFAGRFLSHGNETLFIGIDPNAEVSGDMSLVEMAFPMVDHKYDAAVEMGYQSMMCWDGRMKDKIANRHENWVGYVFWFLKIVSIVCNVIIAIFSLPSRMISSISQFCQSIFTYHSDQEEAVPIIS